MSRSPGRTGRTGSGQLKRGMLSARKAAPVLGFQAIGTAGTDYLLIPLLKRIRGSYRGTWGKVGENACKLSRNPRNRPQTRANARFLSGQPMLSQAVPNSAPEPRTWRSAPKCSTARSWGQIECQPFPVGVRATPGMFDGFLESLKGRAGRTD